MFEARRKAFMEQMGGEGVAIFHSCPEFQRSGDSLEINYRQDSNFYYLTGFEEPESICILAPQHPEHKYILFVPPKDPKLEIWTGKRAGPEGAVKEFGADIAYPLNELEEKLPEILKGNKTLYYSSGKALSFDERMLDLLKRYRRQGFVPRKVVDPAFILAELRVRKSPQELDIMRKAASISAQAYKQVVNVLKPGMYEYEVQAILSYVYQKNGSARHGYAPIVGSGVNATILHYDKNNQQIKDGDLVLIDSGCEYEYYSADITRTYPANGRFTPAQRDIYSLVLKALESNIAMVKPGVTTTDVNDNTIRVLTTGLVELGILQGDVDKLIEEKAYTPFYMHGVSHWLGIDVHDKGPYKRGGAWDEDLKFEPGVVITIEPGLYIGEDNENVDPKYRGIGVRIEDDVIVTATGCENITKDAPKTIEEIEQMMTR
jgi:Xaa-Pro aminopeptidase